LETGIGGSGALRAGLEYSGASEAHITFIMDLGFSEAKFTTGVRRRIEANKTFSNECSIKPNVRTAKEGVGKRHSATVE